MAQTVVQKYALTNHLQILVMRQMFCLFTMNETPSCLFIFSKFRDNLVSKRQLGVVIQRVETTWCLLNQHYYRLITKAKESKNKPKKKK